MMAFEYQHPELLETEFTPELSPCLSQQIALFFFFSSFFFFFACLFV